MATFDLIGLVQADSAEVEGTLVPNRHFGGVVQALAAGIIGSLGASDALIWENDNITWGQADAVYSESKPVMVIGNQFFQVDDGVVDHDQNPIEVALVRTGLTISGKDRKGEWTIDPTIEKLITWIYPVISGVPGTIVKIAVGASDAAHEAIRWAPEQDFRVGIDTFLDSIVSGRFLAVSFRSIGQQPWTLLSYELEVELIGRR